MFSAKGKADEMTTQGSEGDTLWSEFDIDAHSSLVERPLRTLKHGDAFAVLDPFGDIGTVSGTAEGVFYRDTRHLSQYDLRLEGRRPLLLSSAMHADKTALSVDLTNPDLDLCDGRNLRRDILFLSRTKFLWEAVCHERISIRNFDRETRILRLDLLFDASFDDIFEVRGTARRRRGRRTAAVHESGAVSFEYSGLDGIVRRTSLYFEPPPQALEVGRATFRMEVAPDKPASLFVNVACDGHGEPRGRSFLSCYRNMRRARRVATEHVATLRSSNDLFNEVMGRATSDVFTLISRSDLGPYPYAGIPWFSTIFGRDGIITAIFMLWADPSIAQGVLRTLAATQAQDFDAEADAQPGKILHERRQGEMANLGEVPFRRYYGTVDATPLFVLLAALYFERTGDRETLGEIWPNVEAALRWIDEFGDRDGDGFVEYSRQRASGLANQGWKDSFDSIFHRDGSLATGPVALCEVQGYVYAAKSGIAEVAESLGHALLAERLRREADDLREAFDKAFWSEAIGTYALALDGGKRRCEVRSSNAGHALFAGIAERQKAWRIATGLLGREFFSGWGIRTIAQGEARYNPMSYHNGSVWPHDNALIAMGLARYGFKTEAGRVLEALFDAAVHREDRRLPELFCGFIRRPHRGPIAYPVACSPQAWSAAAPFGVLAACLGLRLRHALNRIELRDPVMPDFLRELNLGALRLGDACLDIRLHRYGHDVTANIVSRVGSAALSIYK